jgi:hypothetical protein
MEKTILLGTGREIRSVPETMWKQHLVQAPQSGQKRLAFMTEVHHQVRYFVVRELVNTQKPVHPEYISDALKLPIDQVQSILEELERKLFFLVRNEQKEVIWAYPVTVEPTPHRLVFNSGERLYGA